MTLSIIFYAISFIWIISEIVLGRIKKSDLEMSINKHDENTLRILWITILLSVTIGILVSRFDMGRISILPYQQIFGLILIALGLLIRWNAILKLKENFTVDVSVRRDQSIVKDGIYKFIRHPAYLGSLISFLGLSLMFMNAFTFLIIIIPITISFLHRINIEEKVLTQEIGKEYMEYSTQTKKLIPFIY
jgi:protein-S-isoprenylcysteine O-methyltransferase Ste14